MFLDLKKWMDEYFNDLINMFKILLRYNDTIEDNDKNFIEFCKFIYNN